MTLEQRIAALEQQVASLVGGSEALVPGFTTIDAQGNVGARFTGNVLMAESLASALAGAIAGSQLLWEDASGNIQEWIQGLYQQSPTFTHHLYLGSGRQDGTEYSAYVDISSSPTDSEINLATFLQNSSLAFSRRLLDSLGNSDFFKDYQPLTLTNLLTLANGSTGWLTKDISALVPAYAKFAVCRCLVQGVVANSATYKSNGIDFRRSSTDPICATVAWGFANPSATAIGGEVSQTLYVPLSARTFQYNKTDNINSSSGVTLDLLGYIG